MTLGRKRKGKRLWETKGRKFFVPSARDVRAKLAEEAAKLAAEEATSSDEEASSSGDDERECRCSPAGAPLPSISSQEGRAAFSVKWDAWSRQPCNAQAAEELVGFFAKPPENVKCCCSCSGCAASSGDQGALQAALKRGLNTRFGGISMFFGKVDL